MSFSYFIALSLVCFSSSTKQVPQFNVDLNLPPDQRWTNITLYWQDHIEQMASRLDELMADGFNESTREEWLQYASASLNDEHRAELDGVLQVLHDEGKNEITLVQIYMMNFLYELESPTACSGLLMAMTNGTVIHGRNMDYGFHFMLNNEELNWPDVTYDVTFWRDGQPLLTSVSWPAQIGVHTAMRFGGWSFEQNTRHTNDLWENYEGLKADGKFFATQVREIMETTANFEDAVAAVTSTNFMAPQYFIMVGALPYEGAVVTIDRGGTLLPGTPPVQRINQATNSWHLIQTNDDSNKLPADSRRFLANLRLEPLETADVVNEQFVQNFMITPPLFNPSTVFTWIAVPATGHHQTITRPEAQQLALDINSNDQQIELNLKLRESKLRNSLKRFRLEKGD